MPSVSFNSGSGNWTVPDRVFSVSVQLWGGGGGGSGGGDDPVYGVGGIGGGAGGYCQITDMAFTPGDIIDYSVGAGGAKGVAVNDNGLFGTNGTAGGTTTFGGGSAYAYGGGGADSSIAGDTPGGTATGGITNTTGGAGSDGGAGPGGGTGGSSPNGGAGGTANTNGTAPGGGGGGGDKYFDGGNGAAGRVTFTYTITLSTYNQTMSGGVEAGSSAIVTSRSRVSVSGGVEAGSSAIVTSRSSVSVSGGVEAGSSANSSLIKIVNVSGGVVADSSAVVASRSSISVSGGVTVGSSANSSLIKTVNVSGGVVLAGRQVGAIPNRGRVSFAQLTIPENITYETTVSGGVVSGSTATPNVIYNTTSTGVAVLAGNAIVATDQVLSLGGIIIGGKSRIIGGAQELNPMLDIDAGTWVVAPLYEKIDEVYPDDADFISSASDPIDSSCEVKLEEAIDPASSEGHVVSYRYRKNNVNRPMNLTVQLKEGISLVAEWIHLEIDSNWIEADKLLTTLEADSISDYSNLSLKFIAESI